MEACWLAVIAFSVFVAALVLLFLLASMSGKRLSLKDRHIVVTGGSSGIGKAIAVLAAKEGANVTLLARNKEKLLAASQEVKAANEAVQVRVAAVDVASAGEDGIVDAVRASSADLGPVYVLVNSAGTSSAASFQDTKAEEFRRLMDINYFGTVNATRALLPSMLNASRGGSVVLVSSQAGMLGLYGYSAYSASKFALRGLAEALAMELRPHDVSVTMAFPPDTDTPGFAAEQEDKPEETRLISETAGLFTPEAVAAGILADAKRGRFFSSPGLDGWMLTNLCSGMADGSWPGVAVQFWLMGLLRLVGFTYRSHFHGIVQKCHQKKKRNQ